MTSEVDPNAPSSDHSEFLALLLNRTTMLLGEAAVARLQGKTVAIAGCGGVGGAAAITLARLGVGGFVLADPGIFDEPDLNRQWAGSRATLGRNKAAVHEEMLRQINPNVRLRIFEEGVTEGNLDAFMESADLLVDCLDISVPLTMRTKVYKAAMAKGIYCVSSPIFGFGTLVLFAAPGGMGMDQLIEQFVEVASRESKLPQGFPDWYFLPHVEAIERHIHTHRVPSSAIAPVMATGIISAEIALIFLRDFYPGSREPMALPNVFVVDPLRQTYRVMHHRELFAPSYANPAAAMVERVPPGLDRSAREAKLRDAHHNVVLVAQRDVEEDLFTDSWADLPFDRDSAAKLPPAEEDASKVLEQIYGYAHNTVVFNGRFAEFLLAQSIVERDQVVITNALFPTTRYHLEGRGARLIEAPSAMAHDLRSDDPFKADLNLDRVRQILDEGNVAAIYVELCNNALGGHPMSMANLTALRGLADEHGARLVLDATRAIENAGLVRAREDGKSGAGVLELVREASALAHASAASLTKDFVCPIGGFVGTNEDALGQKMRDLACLMVGSGLSDADQALIARCLARSLVDTSALGERVTDVNVLADMLRERGVPVAAPSGGHAVFIDARAVLTDWPMDARPADALANHVFVESGIRMARNMGTAAQDTLGIALVRLAIPLGLPTSRFAALADAVAAALKTSAACSRLRSRGGPGGIISEFATHFETV